MTKDEIMRLAAQVWSANGVYIGPSIAQLSEFSALVAAKEREACAQVCAIEANTWPYPSHGNAALTMAAAAIRARKETK